MAYADAKEWVVQIKETSALNRVQQAQYKIALQQAIVLSNQLNKKRQLKQHQRQLAQLSMHLSPLIILMLKTILRLPVGTQRECLLH